MSKKIFTNGNGLIFELIRNNNLEVEFKIIITKTNYFECNKDEEKDFINDVCIYLQQYCGQEIQKME